MGDMSETLSLTLPNPEPPPTLTPQTPTPTQTQTQTLIPVLGEVAFEINDIVCLYGKLSRHAAAVPIVKALSNTLFRTWDPAPICRPADSVLASCSLCQ